MSEKRLNLITLQETMDLLEVSRSTLDRWRKHKCMPFIKIGKDIYFHRDELQSWVNKHSSTTNTSRIESASAPETETVTIGYQSGTAHMWSGVLVKELHYFEEELKAMEPARSYSVHWYDAANGLELVEGLITSKIQLASLGDYPIMVSHKISQLLPNYRPVLLAFDGKTPAGTGISIVVPKDSSIRRPSDLIGQTISTVTNSSAGCRLNRLLAPLGEQPVRVIHQDMKASLSSIIQQHVGASAMWEPYVSLALQQGARFIKYEDTSSDDYLTGIVTGDQWLQKNESVVTAYLKAHLRAHQFARKAPFKAAQIISKATGFPVHVTAHVFTQVRWDAVVYTRDLRTLNNLGETGPQHTLNYRSDILEQAVKKLKLPPLKSGSLDGDWSSIALY
ncbi:helix-turn-helix domain-containing protein [Paenibacillus tarimensis]